jgi:hypothetical protein
VGSEWTGMVLQQHVLCLCEKWLLQEHEDPSQRLRACRIFWVEEELLQIVLDYVRLLREFFVKGTSKKVILLHSHLISRSRSRLSIVQLAKVNAHYISTPELSEITNLIEYIDICVGIIIPYFYGSTPDWS